MANVLIWATLQTAYSYPGSVTLPWQAWLPCIPKAGLGVALALPVGKLVPTGTDPTPQHLLLHSLSDAVKYSIQLCDHDNSKATEDNLIGHVDLQHRRRLRHSHLLTDSGASLAVG